jgi:3'-5' exoribonuclease
MGHRYVNQFGDQEAVCQILQASDKQLRPNRNGNLYLQVQLCDRTGSIVARIWNATEALFRSFDNGDYVRVEGTTQIYQGAMQMIATDISKVLSEEVNHGDFVLLTPQKIDNFTVRLAEMLRTLSNPHLRALAECFLMDEEFVRKFTRAPAGVKNHHAYHGGLLEHVVNLMQLVTRVVDCFPAIDRDLLLMGAFVHDMGKIDELTYDKDFRYSDEGQLIGHLVMAVGILETKVREAETLLGEPIPTETVLRLKHMIVSHHGQYDFGSPKLPMTLEAVALHHLDTLDAKLHSFQQLMQDDPTVEGPWTLYHQNLGRKLYRGIQPAREVGTNGRG